MKTLVRIVIACAVLASIAAMVIAYRSDQANTIAVSAALIALMTLIATVGPQLLPSGRGLLQDQIDESLRLLESDVRGFWNTEAAARGLIDNPIRTELRTAPTPAEADPPPAAAEPDGNAGQRSRRGFTAWFGRLFRAGAAEARSDTVEDIASAITDADDRKVTIQDMAADWHESSRRRFLLLGKPGSGKTSVLVNLLRALVNDRKRHEGGRHPVPVFFSASGWDPSVPFNEWIRDQLEREYRYLARRHPRSAGDRERASIASELVASGLVIPFVDGIDEITEEHDQRREAIKRLNADPVFVDAPLVVTCRTEDYREGTKDGEFRLNHVREYELQPLEWQQAAAYLCGAEPTDGLPRTVPPRWRPVVEELARSARDNRSTALTEAMSTPLMVFLAKAAFDDVGQDGPQPAELLEFRTRPELEQRLAGEYLNAVYRPSAGQPRVSDRRLRNTEKILALIANHLQSSGKTDFIWWEAIFLRDAIGTECALRGRWLQSTVKWLIGVVGRWRRRPTRANIIHLSMDSFFWCIFIILTGVGIWILYTEVMLLEGLRPFDSVRGIVVTLTCIVFMFSGLCAFMIGWDVWYGTPSYYQLYQTEKQVTILVRILFVMTVFFAFPLVELIVLNEPKPWEKDRFVYLSMVMFSGIIAVFRSLPVLSASFYLDTTVMLGRLAGEIPWSPPFMRTLEDARERQVLRQVGGAYQFRHRVIQEYLAERTESGLFG